MRAARRTPVVQRCAAFAVAFVIWTLIPQAARGTAGEAIERSTGSGAAAATLQYAYNAQNPRPHDLGPPEKKTFKPYRPLREPPGALPVLQHRRATLFFNAAVVLRLAAIVMLAGATQWAAWRFSVPPALLALLFGLLAGPVANLLDPDALLGNLSLPVISLVFIVLLFDRGLRCELRQVRVLGGVMRAVAGVDVLLTWLVSACCAYFLLRLDGPLAALAGGLMAVAFPTVLVPLLRSVHPQRDLAPLQRLEGAVLDLLGAALAVVLFQAVFFGLARGAGAVNILATTIGMGVVCGALGAGVFLVLRTHGALPESLDTATIPVLILGVFTLGDAVQADAGFIAVMAFAIMLANQRIIRVTPIRGMGAQTASLLESALLVLLAARLRPSDASLVGMGGLLLLAILVLILRPGALALATAGSEARWGERLRLAAQAPRALVPAAATTVFALRLVDGGYSPAARLVPLLLLVVFTASLCELVTALAAQLSPGRRRAAAHEQLVTPT